MTSNTRMDTSAQQPSDIPAVTSALVERYFHGLSASEIHSAGIGSQHDAVAQHFRFADRRLAGYSLIRVTEASSGDIQPGGARAIVEIVTEDIPFLVDSVTMALDRHNVRLLLRIHPVFNVRRDTAGALLELDPSPEPIAGFQRESYMRFQVEGLPGSCEQLEQGIARALDDVMATSRDRQSIRARVIELLSTIGASDDALGASSGQYIDREEMAAFLRWVSADHFVFLGYLNFQAEQRRWQANGESGLGILADADEERLTRLVPISQSITSAEEKIQITQAVERSRVHRNVWIDVIVVTAKENDQFVRHVIVGLFTSIAYGLRPEAIPYLRSKVDYVMRASQLPAGGFGFRTLRDVLTDYPRSELFQTDPDLLLAHSQQILQIQARPRTHVLLRRDYERNVDVCIVYLQRERYSREIRIRIEKYLTMVFGTDRIDHETHMDTSSLAYVYFRLHSATARPSPKDIQDNIFVITTEWRQHVATSLAQHQAGSDLIARFADGFPNAYTERFSAEDAAGDAIRMAQAQAEDRLGIYVYDNDISGSAGLGLKLYSPGSAIALSAMLPAIENLGFEVGVERPYEVQCEDGGVIWMHDFSVRARSGRHLDSVDTYKRIEQALERMWIGDAENDRFNQLVQYAELDWRQTSLIRALCRYLRQMPIGYGENYIIDALVRNPRIVADIVALFNLRFDPDHEKASTRDSESATLVEDIKRKLDAVDSLDEDRILRSLFSATSAIIRTNYFQPRNTEDGDVDRNTLTFKFDSGVIPGLPLPRPLFEIFVYSPRFEGIHLRAGKVARGGLRWSDRLQDFRTEVLGLMKAQVVKNAVIVPVGSKGGFVVRKAFEQPPSLNRDELMGEVVRCYRSFIASMLSITDNLVEGQVVAPAAVIRRDADDPYLVVAADKGTATFSDIANEVSREHGFWLDDAFASGGRTGYDHKAMGITARGAWESVKRHFRGLGIDVQQQPFTVIGIGDMSGDVFGNGMLLSRKIRLLAAFNHRHIFIDPDPDPETSWRERERLFALPRSGWNDYDPALISTGGGVYDRSAKSIELTAQTRALLNVTNAEVSPNELIHLLLKSQVDLLWNGGIGTYVKSSSESHEAAADRAGDALRVNGEELGARVVGEGGNLGMTQPGRVQFCQAGGHCYTDFVDNAAGVHSSDYEVNIKILLNAVVARGDLDDDARNALLASMTDEVAALVLRENYRQTRALSYASHHSVRLFQEQLRLLKSLEASGRLDRAVEHLPDNEILTERKLAGMGLYPPEIAVLQAYAKMDLYEQLLESELPEDPWLVRELIDYFPEPLVQRYESDLWHHQLRRELVSTQVTNQLIDGTHAGFVQRIRELSNASTEQIARAYVITRELFGIDSLHRRIDELDNIVSSETQNLMLMSVVKLTEKSMLQLVGQQADDDIAAQLSRLQDGIDDYRENYSQYILDDIRIQLDSLATTLEQQGVPAALAGDIVAAPMMANALETIRLANETGISGKPLIETYFKTTDYLNLNLLSNFVDALSADSDWHITAKARLRRNLAEEKHGLLASVLRSSGSEQFPDIQQGLEQTLGPQINAFRNRVAGLKELAEVDYAVCMVAVEELAQLHT